MVKRWTKVGQNGAILGFFEGFWGESPPPLSPLPDGGTSSPRRGKTLTPSLSQREREQRPAVIFPEILWFGTGIPAKVVMAALICFFPVIMNTTKGLQFGSLSASRWQVLWKLRFPMALPYIIIALRISSTPGRNRTCLAGKHSVFWICIVNRKTCLVLAHRVGKGNRADLKVGPRLSVRPFCLRQKEAIKTARQARSRLHPPEDPTNLLRRQTRSRGCRYV